MKNVMSLSQWVLQRIF